MNDIYDGMTKDERTCSEAYTNAWMTAKQRGARDEIAHYEGEKAWNAAAPAYMKMDDPPPPEGYEP